MDYYKVLGLSRDASKDEIKEAFRNIAKKFHPDKHSASPKSVRDGATVRFKQASEAYEVLVDDHKRADYNFRSNFSNQGARTGSGYGYGYGYTYDSRKNSDYYGSKKATVSRFQIALGYINSRAFLLNVAFAGAILSGLAVVEIGRDAIWKMQNPGVCYLSFVTMFQNSAFTAHRNHLKKQWNLYRRQKRSRKRNNRVSHFPGSMEVPSMNTQFNCVLK